MLDFIGFVVYRRSLCPQKLTEKDIRAEHAWTKRKVAFFTKSAEESLVPSDNPRAEDPFRLRTHERYPSSRTTFCNGGGIKIMSFGYGGAFHPWAHSEGSPFNLDRAWGRAGRMTSKFSLTPLGLPGRFTIKLEPRIPVIALEIMA